MLASSVMLRPALSKEKTTYLVDQWSQSFSYLKAEINAVGVYQLMALLTFPLCLPPPNFKYGSHKCHSNNINSSPLSQISGAPMI